MCLDIIKEYPPKKKEGLGWKVVYIDRHGDILTSHQWIRLSPSYWNVDEFSDDLTAVEGSKYGTGYHIWLTREGARAWGSRYNKKIVRVKYRKAVCTGLQLGYPVVVAREMKIVHPKKKGGKHV